MPRWIASAFVFSAMRLAVKRDGAPIGRVHAEQRQRELGSARTEQAGEAHDFSGVQLQAHIVIVTIAAKALDFEDNRTGGKVSAPVADTRKPSRSSGG